MSAYDRSGHFGGAMGGLSRSMLRPGKAMDEVVGGPRAGELHVALAHHCAGGRELVLVALDVLAIDEVGDVEDHLAAFSEAAGDLFVEGHEEAMHLEADSTGAGLALASAGCGFAQVAEVFAANGIGDGDMPVEQLCAAVVNEDLEVHLSFAAELFDVALELPLVGAD